MIPTNSIISPPQQALPRTGGRLGEFTSRHRLDSRHVHSSDYSAALSPEQRSSQDPNDGFETELVEQTHFNDEREHKLYQELHSQHASPASTSAAEDEAPPDLRTKDPDPVSRTQHFGLPFANNTRNGDGTFRHDTRFTITDPDLVTSMHTGHENTNTLAEHAAEAQLTQAPQSEPESPMATRLGQAIHRYDSQARESIDNDTPKDEVAEVTFLKHYLANELTDLVGTAAVSPNDELNYAVQILQAATTTVDQPEASIQADPALMKALKALETGSKPDNPGSVSAEAAKKAILALDDDFTSQFIASDKLRELLSSALDLESSTPMTTLVKVAAEKLSAGKKTKRLTAALAKYAAAVGDQSNDAEAIKDADVFRMLDAYRRGEHSVSPKLMRALTSRSLNTTAKRTTSKLVADLHAPAKKSSAKANSTIKLAETLANLGSVRHFLGQVVA